ncbi:hypothetical protein Syun_017162 [Stephania yunnanensis]|uniref:Uncharacterized protein n=1 Tax=Stephania yunnanensis TaxID=152371 RepID=A0AAP0P4Q6_9MAGN
MYVICHCKSNSVPARQKLCNFWRKEAFKFCSKGLMNNPFMISKNTPNAYKVFDSLCESINASTLSFIIPLDGGSQDWIGLDCMPASLV